MNKLMLAGTATLFVAAAANAQFNPGEWSVGGLGGYAVGGSIQIDPNKMLLTSDDNGSGYSSLVAATYVSPMDGKKVTFDWAVVGSVDTGSFDLFGYYTDATGFVVLANNETAGGGSASVLLSAGESFSLFIYSDDNLFGSLQVSVTNFSSVPAPGALALLGLAGLAGRRRRN